MVQPPTFLSTLPARGATAPFTTALQPRMYFYPRSPRGERRSSLSSTPSFSKFLSTLPARGATLVYAYPCLHLFISIHAPREGSDLQGPGTGKHSHHFYPRSPRGERQFRLFNGTTHAGFLSTLPARGATQGAVAHLAVGSISIHAPREGSDPQGGCLSGPRERISIHAPREGSDGFPGHRAPGRLISIHAPREGSDQSEATGGD